MILPPFLDCHTHIPQWPIRGRFCEGIVGEPEGGRLLAGLNRNVFPAERKCRSVERAKAVVDLFAQDTLANGVVGGAAFMTVHAAAAAVALQRLSPLWSVGLVLMNQNCPTWLRTDEKSLDEDVARLAGTHGRRFIVTDRFAVAVDSPLRRRAVALAGRFGLRMQTHLNEQKAEKRFVEKVLYKGRGSYTDVYADDGLLDREAILAHCVQMSPGEFDTVAAKGCAIAHCPTSNALLGSGVMNLDAVLERDIPYAICTDVGASPVTSMLAEMAVFLKAHRGRSAGATPSEALYRTTLGAAKILGISGRVGDLSVGRPASFIEVEAGDGETDCGDGETASGDADAVIRHRLLGTPTLNKRRTAAEVARETGRFSPALDWAVKRVVLDGVERFDLEKAAADAKTRRRLSRWRPGKY